MDEPSFKSTFSVTLRFTGMLPGWIGFGPSPGRNMLGTDAWVTKVFSASGVSPVNATTVEGRNFVRSTVTGPFRVDTVQDVALSYTASFSPQSDPGASVYFASPPTSVLYIVLTRPLEPSDPAGVSFNATTSSAAYFA